MTAEQLQRIRKSTDELLEEIEYVELYGGTPHVPMRDAIEHARAQPGFATRLHELLDNLFAVARTAAADVVGHQEIVLEAVGMIQTAMKRALYETAPHLVGALDRSLIATKFTRFDRLIVHAPPGVWVPSLQEQTEKNRGK